MYVFACVPVLVCVKVYGCLRKGSLTEKESDVFVLKLQVSVSCPKSVLGTRSLLVKINKFP